MSLAVFSSVRPNRKARLGAAVLLLLSSVTLSLPASAETARPAKTEFKFGLNQAKPDATDRGILEQHGQFIAEHPEVRITLHEVEVDLSELIDGLVRLQLDYTVRTTNTCTNMVYPLYLREGTNLRQPA